MLPFLAITALATLAVAPSITFTTDSTYTNENVLVFEVRENYEEETLVSKDLVIQQRPLLGYTIYDVPETPYIDGIKVDDAWVYDWIVKDYDDSVEHSITVKTVYTDDIAGMLAAAKDGNWVLVLSNPIILIQLAYYILAAASVIVGGVGLLKSRKKKIKDHNEIAASVSVKATEASEGIKTVAIEIVKTIVKPVIDKLALQNQKIIEAFILSQSSDKTSKLALIDILKESTTVNSDELANSVIKQIEAKDIAKQEAKEQASKIVQEISTEPLEEVSETEEPVDLGGLKI